MATGSRPSSGSRARDTSISPTSERMPSSGRRYSGRPSFSTENTGHARRPSTQAQQPVPRRLSDRPMLALNTTMFETPAKPAGKFRETFTPSPPSSPLRGDMARGDGDYDCDPRAAAPWATEEAFVPVGLDKAFTPSSMRQEYFSSPPSGIDTAMHELALTEVEGLGLKRRPAVRDRLRSAPIQVAETQYLKQLPAESVRIVDTRRRTFATLHQANREESFPEDSFPRAMTQAPPVIHRPQPIRPPMLTPTGTTASSRSSFKQTGAKAWHAAVDVVRTAVHKAKPRRASSYQPPSSLAEHALNQPAAVRHPADYPDGFEARDIANLSPASCEHLFRAVACPHLDPAARAQAGIAFTARQQVHHTLEGQAQAALTRRQIQEEYAAAATPPARARSSSQVRSLEEVLEAHRLEERARHEQRAREFVAEQKQQAEQLALQNPDKYPGLRRH